jgi:hypothetical protein
LRRELQHHLQVQLRFSPMLPKLIHLIWFGEDAAGLATAAEQHWLAMGAGREVILHRDASALLPEWQDAWELAANHSMQSDLLRWSLLLTQGGWYFDCDVRSRLPLDRIEAECQLDDKRCFVTLFGSRYSTPATDILACGPNWPGRAAVIDYVRSRHDRARIHNWTFAGEMLSPIYREHPKWFLSAPPEQYSMMTAPRDQLVFLRGGQTTDWLDRHPRCARSTKSPQPRTPSGTARGSGDYLHDAIQHWIGESPTLDCQCRSRIAQMNAWGPAGCCEHLEEIVGWLADEAAKRGWWRCAVALPGSRIFLRRMVLAAINKAESGLHYTST